MLKKRFFKTKDECEVTFEVNAEGAERVELICDANDWQPVAMKRARKGPFRTKLRLPKEGRFEFRYLVDRESWINDDSADDYCPNHLGGQNGVLETAPMS